MNSVIERVSLVAGLALLSLLGGCADRGPTNLYSQPLFNQGKDGAQMELDYRYLDKLAGTGNVGFVLVIKNRGNGSTVGPILATLSIDGACATAQTFTATAPTAIFGEKGKLIQPGDELRGHAVNSLGVVQNWNYAYLVSYDTAHCAGSSVSFTVSAKDSRGSSWTMGFTDIAQ